MNTFSRFFFGLFLATVSIFNVTAAHAEEWTIDAFHSDITIEENTTLDVTETIEVTFEEERRGIFRDIPYHYRDALGQPYTMHLRVHSVTDVLGKPHPYVLQYDQGEFVRIRVGDADTWITGKQTYVIHYTAQRAFLLQEEGAIIEFPWNITGTWDVPLNNVSASVSLPDSPLETICFTGVQGSIQQDCTITEHGASLSISPITRNLPLYHQLTYAVQLPAASLTLPSQLQYLLWYLQDNYILVYAGLMIMTITVLWWRYGKDYPLDTIMPRWEVPEDMTPFHTHLLRKETLPARQLPAGIIYLATRGFLTISKVEGGKHYILKKSDRAPDSLPPAEQKLYEGIFGTKDEVSTSDLRKKFYVHISGITDAANEDVVKRGWFYYNPSAVLGLYMIAGGLLTMLGAIWAIAIEQGVAFLVVVAAGIYWMVFSFCMPKKTREGRRRDAEILGLREYIQRADTLRLKIKNPPGHTRNEFDRLLPYAMALGLEEAWAKQFEDVLETAPTWIEGDASTFTKSAFLGSLRTFADVSKESLTIAPSSSTSSSYSSSGGSSFGGGGFSGGGFGGGGGGSW